MKIAVFGCGYVGLAYIALLSEKNKIVAYDVDSEKVELLKSQKISLSEEELPQTLKRNFANIEYKLYDTSTNLSEEEVFFLCLPTNYNKKTQELDTSALTSVIKHISAQNKKALIIIKSTIPMGYTEGIIEKTENENIVFMPEFLREGHSLYDVKHPSRMVLGTNEKTQTKAKSVLKKIGLVCEKIPFFVMNCKEAESVKLFSNTYLAMRIAFFNELDTFCLQNNLNCKNIIEGVCSDSRIGNFYNNPSFGFGGYCLEKDTNQCAKFCLNGALIKNIIKSNNQRRKNIVEKILTSLPNKKEKVVGIYKLEFKKGSDNNRNSVMIKLINDLLKQDIKVIIYDLKIKEKEFLNCKVEKDFSVFAAKCDLILTNRLDSQTRKLKQVFSRDVFETN